MVEEGELKEETIVVTVLLEQIAMVAATIASVGLTIPVVRKVVSELDLV